jgi:hypothetical protein
MDVDRGPRLLHTARNAAGVIFLSKSLSQAAGIEHNGTEHQTQVHPHLHLEVDSRSQSVWQGTGYYHQRWIDSKDLGLAGTLPSQNHTMDLHLGSLDELYIP